MKRYLFVPVVLVGLLQNAPFAAGQARKTPLRKAAATGVRKKTSIKPAPPVDPTIGDNVDGDDLTIRRAAVEALGTSNGSVVVADPTNGRILTIVNQKLALQSGFIPCSTIKLVTSLAALSDHVIARESWVAVSRYLAYNMDTAIAMSNNEYFSILGKRLGFDRVVHYAQMLGLGEKAGLDIPGEQPGEVPTEMPKGLSMGLLTAYGESFQVTPLELTALLSAIANGGTLYYLQYPKTAAEIEAFTPKVKRPLELSPNSISDLRIGMRGAVDYGTARKANYDPAEPILGKTGTCTDFRFSSHMGWFGSFNDVGKHQLVVVVMLMSPHSNVGGGTAAAVAGNIYRSLSEQHFFAADAPNVVAKKSDLPEIIVSRPIGNQDR